MWEKHKPATGTAPPKRKKPVTLSSTENAGGLPQGQYGKTLATLNKQEN